MKLGRFEWFFSNLSLKNLQVSCCMTLTSIYQFPLICNPWIWFFLLLLLRVPWKNLLFSSPSTSHLILDFCFKSRRLMFSIAISFFLPPLHSAISDIDNARVSTILSISKTRDFRSKKLINSLSISTLLHCLIAFFTILWGSYKL